MTKCHTTVYACVNNDAIAQTSHSKHEVNTIVLIHCLLDLLLNYYTLNRKDPITECIGTEFQDH